MRDDDERLREERFQTGHMIGIYWATVSRWMVMRARRDARTLGSPLILIQAADVTKPPMPKELAMKLMNKPNPEPSNIHSMLVLHVGMRVRLLDALDVDNGLVKDSEGDVVKIVPHPADSADFDAMMELGQGMLYLKHPPLGVWLRMEKYTGAPFVKKLQGSMRLDDIKKLVFVEPTTARKPFEFRGHMVMRTGLPLSHARVVTSTACQGRTMRKGVILDCGRQETGCHPMEDDDWWLDLYVMLSRATSLDDLLLVRAPDLEFFLKGPPRNLTKQLSKLARRTDICRKNAENLCQELGLGPLLR